MLNEIAERIDKVISSSPVWAEMRYHRRESQSVQVQKSVVKQAKSLLHRGVGVRALVDGAWGFSSTSDLSLNGLNKALRDAIECAQSLSKMKKAAIPHFPQTQLVRGSFTLPGYEELRAKSLEEKLVSVVQAEALVRKASSTIQSGIGSYSEIFEDKAVITTDGARALTRLGRAEFRVTAFASKGGDMAEGSKTVGKTGPWECLFQEDALLSFSEQAAALAVDLVSAPKIQGGPATLILSPGMVGLLSHEAIGHTVEADFVLSGSVAAGKIGAEVASPLVTLCDAGSVESSRFGGGDLQVDDEGVAAGTTTIIKEGKLVSYLHNRESAAHFNVAPTGNARAWLYQDEPLIRMRNTYIAPGTESLEEIIARTESGYLVDGPLGGQADATGEFMFGAQRVSKIDKGKITQVFRGATISGQAFDVLSTVDAVSKEFRLDLGAGYCGKGQPAKVDAGGPFIRCRATIGGVQS